MTIRPAVSTDLEFLLQGTLALHRHEANSHQTLHPDFEANLKQWLAHCLASQNHLVLIVETDKPTGFLLGDVSLAGEGLLANPLIGKIHILWIEKNARRSGAARRLLDEFIVSCKQLGAGAMEAEYTANNAEAREFWSAQGFEVDAVKCRRPLTN